MSKIYEALQNVEQETRLQEKPKAQLAKTSPATLLPAVVELDLENEMIALYQNIETLLPDLERKVLQFIGARKGEGTSTIVREFARVAAKKLDKSVFLLDVGVHNPRQCVFFHITPECGWEEVTSDGNAYTDCEMDLQECKPLFHPPMAPVNFYSPQILGFWEYLKRRYDLILVDSPPASLSPDGIEISRRADGVVLVVEAEKTRWQVVEHLKAKIEQGGGNILGLVFNKRRYYIPDTVYRRL